MLAQCPWCGSRFDAERSGRQACPVCSAEIDVPEPEAAAPQPGPAGPPPPEAGLGHWEQTSTTWESWEGEAPAEAAPVPEVLPPAPWERMRELGFWQAFSQTWVGASLHPSRFFQGLGPHPSIWPAFLFALLVSGAASVASTFWTELLARSVSEDAGFLFPLIAPQAQGALGVWAFSNLVSSAVGIFVIAGITHLGCMVFGAASRGFTTTFRTVAFSMGPALLGVLPGLGLLSYIWVYAILITGLRITQETTTGRATLAALFPFVVLGAFVIVITAAAAVFFLT